MDLILARRWWLVPVAAVVGILIGLLVSLLGPTERRAEAAVLVSSPRGTAAVTPFLPNLRELAKSGVLAGNVRSTLRLEESLAEVRDHLDAEVRPQSQVIVIAATDDDADKARQIAQEAAVVFTRLVESRFGTRTPPLQAALIDSAQVLTATNRHFVRNVLIGAAAGLILGGLAALLLARERFPEAATGPRAGAMADLRRRESLLKKRVQTQSARERELAKRAGQLAARERDIGKREGKLAEEGERAAARVREVDERRRELDAREHELEAQPAAVPEPVPAELPGSPAAAERVGSWNVNDLQRIVDARSNATPEQAEQLRTYLFFLREHADSAGTLPPTFDALVSDVFGELLQ